MGKPGYSSTAHGVKAYNTVFVDTSIDTHLVLIVSNTETVSDLKEKIHCEHPACFPDIGDITIHSMKIKRRKKLYNLSDSMFVKNAFEGINNSWFVFVDVSTVGKYIENGHPQNSDLNNTGTIPELPEVGVERKDLSGEPDTGFALVQVSNDGTISEPCPTSPAVKLFDPIQDAGLKNDEMDDADACREKRLSLSIDQKAVKFFDPIQETRLKDDEMDDVDADKEKRLSLSIDQKTSADIVERVVSADGGVDPGKSIKRKKKSKKQLSNTNSGDSKCKNEASTLCCLNASEEHHNTNVKGHSGPRISEENITENIEPLANDDTVIINEQNMSGIDEAAKALEGGSDLQVSIVNNSDEQNRSGSDQMPIADNAKDLPLNNEPTASAGIVERIVSNDGREDTGKSLKRKTISKKQLDSIDGDSESKIEKPTLGTVHASEEHHVINVEGNFDLLRVLDGNNTEKVGFETNELISSGVNQMATTDKEKDLSMSNDLKASARIVERVESAEGNVETGKSFKKTKKSKKQLEPVAEHFRDLFTPAKAISGDHMTDDVEKGEADGKSVKRIKKSKKQLEPVTEHSRDFGSLAKAVKDDHLMEDVRKQESDTVIQNVLISLQRSNKDKKRTDRTDKKLKKKATKKINEATISILGLQTTDRNVSPNDPALSHDIRKVDEDSLKVSKMLKFVNPPTTLNEMNPGLKSNIMVGAADTQLSSEDVRSSDAHHGNNEEESPQVNAKSDPSENCAKVPCNAERIDFSDNLVASQPENEIDALGEIHVDKVTNKKESNEKKGKLKRKKHDSHSDGPLHKSYVNQNGAQADYLGTTKQQKSFSKDKISNVLPKSTLESSKGKHKQSNRGSNVSAERSFKNKAREIVNGSHASRKASGNKGALVNKSETKKSLLAMSGSIFKDDYNGNSEDEDEDGVHNSDTSTKAPSDANVNTPTKGSYSIHGKQHGERNTISLSYGAKDLSLHKILKNSSSYKKAKLTASKLQSEDLDLVPDGRF